MKDVSKTEYFLIFFLLAATSIAAIVTLSDYGQGWDEDRLYSYADQSLNAYRALYDPNVSVDFGDDDLKFYGPAYLVGASLLVNGVQHLLPNVSEIDLWHIGNFICFQIGVFCFYWLLRRFTGVFPSITTTALFATQPLFWGHSFINPKDIPFTVFYIASVYAGLKMLDDFEAKNFDIKQLATSRYLYIATLLLGLTISIRILGFTAGMIVLFYLAFIRIDKVLRLSYLYFSLPLIVTFITWPYLWQAPITNFLTSVNTMLNFHWPWTVLFKGVYYRPGQLPRSYVPQLFSMQLSETALILFAVGIIAMLFPANFKRHKKLLTLFFVWFVVPLIYILTKGMRLYDNTRQLLFMLPGGFLTISMSLELISEHIKSWQARMLLFLLILSPGIIGIINYHPYEYTYYNYFTIANKSIFRNYETDYWGTSLKQISSYINNHVPENSYVVVRGPYKIVQNYARDDIVVVDYEEMADTIFPTCSFYIVLLTRWDFDLSVYPDVEPVYLVEHNGSVLSVIKHISPQSSNLPCGTNREQSQFLPSIDQQKITALADHEINN